MSHNYLSRLILIRINIKKWKISIWWLFSRRYVKGLQCNTQNMTLCEMRFGPCEFILNKNVFLYPSIHWAGWGLYPRMQWAGVCVSQHALGRGCLPGGVSQHALGQTAPVDRMTDRCKNITLLQLRCGRNKTSEKSETRKSQKNSKFQSGWKGPLVAIFNQASCCRPFWMVAITQNNKTDYLGSQNWNWNLRIKLKNWIKTRTLNPKLKLRLKTVSWKMEPW